ncbi:threonine/homoserine/homoserine lactone efflux protein [Bradyrhizobium sp. F1.2.2]
MIDHTTLITYILIVLGFVFIPGPATLLTMARAASSGTRVGIATGAGIAAGDVVHTTMAIVGLSAVIATSALLFSVVKYAGAGFLIYLGIRAMLDKTPLEVNGGAPAISAARAFRQAVLTEVLNPKTALFFLAFLPQFVRPEHGSRRCSSRCSALSSCCSASSARWCSPSAPVALAICYAAIQPS